MKDKKCKLAQEQLEWIQSLTNWHRTSERENKKRKINIKNLDKTNKKKNSKGFKPSEVSET